MLFSESENITDGNNDESDGMSDLSNAGMDLVHFLEQNDHFELSFHCLSMFTSTCTQYTHRNSMGYPKYIQNEVCKCYIDRLSNPITAYDKLT